MQRQLFRRSRRAPKTSAEFRGTYVASTEASSSLPSPPGYFLQSDERRILAKLYGKYGSEKFTKSRAPDIPEWLYANAVASELENRKGQYEHVRFADVPPDANIVGSHLFYRIKKDEKEQFKFKARLVLHGMKKYTRTLFRRMLQRRTYQQSD